MLTIKIENLEYGVFEQIRDAIVETVPFAVDNVMYSKKLKVGIFGFWDSRYIPESLRKMAMPIPGNAELIAKLDAKIKAIEKF